MIVIAQFERLLDRLTAGTSIYRVRQERIARHQLHPLPPDQVERVERAVERLEEAVARLDV